MQDHLTALTKNAGLVTSLKGSAIKLHVFIYEDVAINLHNFQAAADARINK